jgi:hypothetical protein
MNNFNKIFMYCESTGLLTYKIKRGKILPGTIAGTLALNGYVTVGVDKKKHYAHRIIWEMLYGTIPAGTQIDHINGNRSDNRLCNLRLASNHENSKNQKRKSNNSSGFTGVSWDSQTQRWLRHHQSYRCQTGTTLLISGNSGSHDRCGKPVAGKMDPDVVTASPHNSELEAGLL